MKTTTTAEAITEENFTRLPSDVNGNPRYYLPAFLTTEAAARSCGAVKYRGKQYGAGWVFQTYSLRSDCATLNRAAATAATA